MQRISERALDGLNTLKTLNLRNNLLKKIDNGLLRGTPALLSINVQANKLETLTFYTFQPIMDNLVNSTSELLVSGECPQSSRNERTRTWTATWGTWQKADKCTIIMDVAVSCQKSPTCYNYPYAPLAPFSAYVFVYAAK